MTRFVIDIGDIEISKEDHLEIQSELQAVTLRHISKAGFDKPFVVKFPRDWYGAILNPDLDRIEGLERDIGSLFKG